MARASPFRHRNRTKSPKPYFSKSPLRHRRNPGDDFTRRNRDAPRPSHSSARTFRARNLQPIHEENPSPTQRHPRTSHNSYRSFGLDEDTYYDGPSPSDEEDEEPLYEDSFFHWEEESTLFSDLMEEAPEEDKDQRMESLANSLQNSFDICGRELKKEIAETLVPTVNHVKALYRVLDEKVDLSFGKGVIIFNTACKEAEAMAIKEQDDLARAYATTQGKVEDLLAQLKEAYASRDRLWAEFEKAIDATAEPTLETLKNLPGKVEHIITNLERHAKALEKDDSGSTEKKIKGILSKIS